MGSTRRIVRIAMWLALFASTAPASSAFAQAQAPDMREIFPYMMLVIDTSGSMERKPACTCDDLACLNCLPTCNPSTGLPERNRWAVTLEALTGTFNSFSCEPLDRTTFNGATYDVGYYMPYHQPWDCAGQAAGSDCAFNTNTLTPPVSTRNQNEDGILDEYKGRVNFGLMTFDGYATYVGAPQLQPVAAFDEDLSEAVQGLWSYGGAKSFHYPNCTTDYMMDTGARSSVATEGSLISINSCQGSPGDPTCPSWCGACWGTDPSEISNQLNEDIQEALLSTRPYGGTPIAASLEDLFFHFTDDISDAFGGCRKRFALLMTDGEPDADYRDLGCDCDQGTNPLRCGPPPNDPAQMHCPYEKAEDIAFDLVHGRGSVPAQIERLFVIGLAVESQTTEASLDAIARAGCTLGTACLDPLTNHEALFATNLQTLVSGLQEKILSALEPISRSVPVFANTTSTTNKQFQISTGFEVPVGRDAPWTGIIERSRFTCNGTAPQQEVLDASDRLHDRIRVEANPTLKTVVPDLDQNAHVFGSTATTPCGAAGAGELSGCDMVALNNATVTTEVLGLGAQSTQTMTDRTNIMNWMFGTGGSVRVGKKLGDIYHSSPVILGRPQFDTVDEAFNAFRVSDKVRNRPITMFVNTNDGMIRAIALETAPAPTGSAIYLTGTTAGDQFFGFIPPLLLDDLDDNLTGHRMTMDGTPVVKDVYFDRIRGERAELSAAQFHTVLITGMRGGGQGETNAYVALEVTNPQDPKFLWQFSDPDDPSDPWDSAMGKSYAQPAIVQASYQFDYDAGAGVDMRVKNGAVAILPGGVGLQGNSGWTGDCNTTTGTRPGMKNTQGREFFTFEAPPLGAAVVDEARHRVEVRCWRNPGRALYFVDVETGRIIKKIHNSGPNTLPLFPSPLIGTPAVFPGDPGTTASKAFITDADGVIWRIDMSAQDPAPTSPSTGWTARPFHDVFWDRSPTQGEVTYEAPILSVDEQGRVVVIVGTGDTDNFNKVTVENRVVSLTEVRDATTGIPAAELFKAAFNWEKRVKPTGGLVPSELVTGSMALFGGQLYFGTFIAVSGSNACDAGKGRVFAVDYLARDPADSNPTVGAIQTFGPLEIDNPEFDAYSDAVSVVNVSATAAVDNLFIQGLGVTQGPTCSAVDTTSFDVFSQDMPAIQSVNQPALFLVAQGRGPISVVSPTGGGRLGGVQLAIKRPRTKARVLSWATSVD